MLRIAEGRKDYSGPSGSGHGQLEHAQVLACMDNCNSALWIKASFWASPAPVLASACTPVHCALDNTACCICTTVSFSFAPQLVLLQSPFALWLCGNFLCMQDGGKGPCWAC